MVCEYLRQLELLAATLEDVSEHVQESTFINGLRPEIRVKVRRMNPEGLREIMKFAQRVEERNLSGRRSRGGSWGSRSTVMGSSQPTLQNGPRGSRMSPLQTEPPIGQPNTTTCNNLWISKYWVLPPKRIATDPFFTSLSAPFNP